MKSRMSLRFAAGAAGIGLLACSLASAQLSVEKVTATNQILQQMKATINKLPLAHQQMLDGYANISNLADVWRVYGMRLTDPSFIARAKRRQRSAGDVGDSPRFDPATDLAYSSFAGFTQSETSAARCGESVVIGYNDSGSVFETPFFFTGSGGESFSGASYSIDGGDTFNDIGPINPGPNKYNFLGGDPVVTCANPNTFHYTQIFTTTRPAEIPGPPSPLARRPTAERVGAIRSLPFPRTAIFIFSTSPGPRSILQITTIFSFPTRTSITRRPTPAARTIPRELPLNSSSRRIAA